VLVKFTRACMCDLLHLWLFIQWKYLHNKFSILQGSNVLIIPIKSQHWMLSLLNAQHLSVYAVSCTVLGCISEWVHLMWASGVYSGFQRCPKKGKNFLQWILTKLGTYLVLRRVGNPIDFQGQGHWVNFLPYNILVNTVESTSFSGFWPNLVHT
jgi:hypothetical protein